MVILVLLTIQGYIRRHIQRFNAAHEVHLRSIHVNLCLRLAWFIPHPFCCVCQLNCHMCCQGLSNTLAYLKHQWQFLCSFILGYKYEVVEVSFLEVFHNGRLLYLHQQYHILHPTGLLATTLPVVRLRESRERGERERRQRSIETRYVTEDGISNSLLYGQWRHY